MATLSDLPLLQSSVKDVLNFQSEAAVNTAQATAKQTEQQGDTTEAGLYGTAAQIAGNNSDLEGVAGNIQEIQQQRDVAKAVGKQGAATAANGFVAGYGTGGSAMYLARESMQQGYLTQQLTRTQTQINQGGFLEQKTAAQTEQAAAQAAAAEAGTLSSAYSNAAAISTANAANETTAINNLTAYDKQAITANGGTISPYQQATLDVVQGALTGVAPANVSGSLTPQQIFGSDAGTGALGTGTNLPPGGATTAGAAGVLGGGGTGGGVNVIGGPGNLGGNAAFGAPLGTAAQLGGNAAAGAALGGSAALGLPTAGGGGSTLVNAAGKRIA